MNLTNYYHKNGVLVISPCSADISRLVSLAHDAWLASFVLFALDKGDDGLDCGMVA